MVWYSKYTYLVIVAAELRTLTANKHASSNVIEQGTSRRPSLEIGQLCVNRSALHAKTNRSSLVNSVLELASDIVSSQVVDAQNLVEITGITR